MMNIYYQVQMIDKDQYIDQQQEKIIELQKMVQNYQENQRQADEIIINHVLERILTEIEKNWRWTVRLVYVFFSLEYFHSTGTVWYFVQFFCYRCVLLGVKISFNSH